MAVSCKRSTRQKLDLFKRYFTGLTNIYGTYDPSTGRAWQVKEPVNDKVLLDHLRGRKPYGVYLLTGETTRALALDCDTEDRDLPTACVVVAHHYQIPAYIERSKSKGYHVWMFFESRGVAAAKARVLAANILAELEAEGTEIFPKQDRLGSSISYGNFINAPLFGRLVPEGRTVFIDPATFKPYPDQWDILESVVTISESHLDDLIEMNGWEIEPTPSPPQEDQAETDIDNFGLPACARKMLLNGVQRYQRVSCFRLAVHFKRLGLPYDLAVSALKTWSLKNRPLQGKGVITEQEILDQSQYAYSRPYRGYGCRSEAVSAFCEPDCPVLTWQGSGPGERTEAGGTP